MGLLPGRSFHWQLREPGAAARSEVPHLGLCRAVSRLQAKSFPSDEASGDVGFGVWTKVRLKVRFGLARAGCGRRLGAKSRHLTHVPLASGACEGNQKLVSEMAQAIRSPVTPNSRAVLPQSQRVRFAHPALTNIWITNATLSGNCRRSTKTLPRREGRAIVRFSIQPIRPFGSD